MLAEAAGALAAAALLLAGGGGDDEVPPGTGGGLGSAGEGSGPWAMEPLRVRDARDGWSKDAIGSVRTRPVREAARDERMRVRSTCIVV